MARFAQYLLAVGLVLASAVAARGQVQQVQPEGVAPQLPPGDPPPPPPPTVGNSPLDQPPPPERFPINPKAPAKDLLPKAPKVAKRAPALPRDLAEVPEILFEGPVQPKAQPGVDPQLEHIAYTVARVNHLNGREKDGFLKALIANRPDLRGLPFRMGDECRMSPELNANFTMWVQNVRTLMSNQVSIPISQARDAEKLAAQQFWTQFRQFALNNVGDPAAMNAAQRESLRQGEIRGLMQIMMPEAGEMQLGFVRYLATVSHKEATVALARLAVFAQEESVRDAAVEALKIRRERDYTEVLTAALRYPLPSVARHAAEAIVELDRKDMVPTLVSLLEEADPRLPVAKDNGYEVREVVRLNHNRNCLLCHPAVNSGAFAPVVPGAMSAPVATTSVLRATVEESSQFFEPVCGDQTEGEAPAQPAQPAQPGPDDLILQSGNLILAQIPVPGQPLPVDSTGGYGRNQPDILVRIDQTYLRQDFSVMLPVEDAEPWPARQRFDFLVRTRAVDRAEAEALRKLAGASDNGVSPYRVAALAALRGLTGRDLGPDAAAWRKSLNVRGQ